MKGFVFREFFDFVDKNYGMAATEKIVEAADLGHEGAYASTGTYPFSDLQKLIAAACDHTGENPKEMLEAFGHSAGCAFTKGHAAYFERYDSLFSMLPHVDGLIHVEVRKLHPEAELPRFVVLHADERQITMRYVSVRRLWDFAKGIICAASRYFGEHVSVKIERDEDSPDEALITVTRL